jgi:hypothetical protein
MKLYVNKKHLFKTKERAVECLPEDVIIEVVQTDDPEYLCLALPKPVVKARTRRRARRKK